ncbi:MAG: CTP-dependent riboflavin kinase [Desulfurococcales archaeon]|nr:CTP-dependent riboflavin kinase [Desulfurococcales archaeon]
MTTLKGLVFSGKGEGEFYINLYARNIRAKLGFIPYPGTLNVRILDEYTEKYQEAIMKIIPVIVDPPLIPGSKLGRAVFYTAYLHGVKVYIVRPEITVYGFDVIEIVAPFNIRQKFGLRDGDEVEIEI